MLIRKKERIIMVQQTKTISCRTKILALKMLMHDRNYMIK